MNAVTKAAISSDPIARQGLSTRSDSRTSFDKFDHTVRYYAEVNVAGFDITRSIAKAKKKKQKQRAEQARPPSPPVLTPPQKSARNNRAKKVDTCPPEVTFEF